MSFSRHRTKRLLHPTAISRQWGFYIDRSATTLCVNAEWATENTKATKGNTRKGTATKGKGGVEEERAGRAAAPTEAKPPQQARAPARRPATLPHRPGLAPRGVGAARAAGMGATASAPGCPKSKMEPACGLGWTNEFSTRRVGRARPTSERHRTTARLWDDGAPLIA